ncbi:hypothetical protein [Krasilnikovia sp. MM14-A1259]|uniref:hypothetical protein n=1 Tax=Krasilnikovia sp. MM14-A1259 TaxID=3373539 RepID=UPI0037F1F090
MSGPDRTHQMLTLLARPGAYEVLRAMRTRDGTATFAQIATEAPRPMAVLRSLAVYDLVIAPCCGSLDVDPCGTTYFCLTARGEAVIGHLDRLQQWAATRNSGRGNGGLAGWRRGGSI